MMMIAGSRNIMVGIGRITGGQRMGDVTTERPTVAEILLPTFNLLLYFLCASLGSVTCGDVWRLSYDNTVLQVNWSTDIKKHMPCT